MADTQTCTGCGRSLPVTREFFGNTPSGGFRRKCRSCMADHTAAYQAANPEQSMIQRAARQIRSAAAGTPFTPHDVAVLRIAQSDCCAYCMCPLDGAGHVDHMTPLSRGGSHALHNLALACRQCNAEKHAKTVYEYFLWRYQRGLPVYVDSYGYQAALGSEPGEP